MYTYYVLKKDGVTFFKNKNTACFAEIFSAYNPSQCIRKIFAKKTNEELEFLVSDDLEEEEVKKYLKRMSRLGIKTTYRILNKKDMIEWHGSYRGGDKDLFILVTIKLSDYEDPKLFKLHVHALRLLIEDSRIIKKYVKSKVPVGLDCWQFLRIISSIDGDRHGFFQGVLNREYGNNLDGYTIYGFQKNERLKNLIPLLADSDWDRSSTHVTTSLPRITIYIKNGRPDGLEALMIFLSRKTKIKEKQKI
jgi:hypothetical protein